MTISKIPDVEIYALKHKNELIFIGRTKDEISDCIVTHFANCLREYDKYIEFYPKLYSYIKNNPNIKEYGFSSLGKFNRNQALVKCIEFIQRFKTDEKCNSRKRVKDPESTSLKLDNSKKTKKRYFKYYYICDQNGKVFDSITECSEYYGVEKCTIRGRTLKSRKNSRNWSENKEFDGLTFSKVAK